MESTCFVIMAISDQNFNDVEVTSEELKSNYENVLKPAILAASPQMEILRADECAVPGTITTDILTHLMYDDFVIADLSYPNPNVYYELGLRHCFKPGTILLRNKNVKISAPFDISHQRYIEYDTTAKGVQDLSRQLKDFFSWYKKNPTKSDNQVLHLAELIKFQFPQYTPKERNKTDMMVSMFSILAENPGMLETITDNSITDDQKGIMALQMFKDNPTAIRTLLEIGMQNENL